MDHQQAHRLWFSTLALGRDDLGADRLQGIWGEAGLTASETRPLAAVLEEADVDERRRRLIQRTRLLLIGAGYTPDLLSTPAARMRGL